MNPLSITIIIAVATFIISIFGASWLNQQAMNRRIDDLKSYLDARFDAVNAQFEVVNAQFDTLNNRIASLDGSNGLSANLIRYSSRHYPDPSPHNSPPRNHSINY